MKRLLIGLASIVSMQALALPNIEIQDVTYHNQYSFDFTTPSGIYSVSETSSEEELFGDYSYGSESEPYYDGYTFLEYTSDYQDITALLRASITPNGSINLSAGAYSFSGSPEPSPDRYEHSGTGLADFSAFTSINVLFDVIGDPVELVRLATNDDFGFAEHTFSLTGNGTNIDDTSVLAGGVIYDSFLLTEGSYNLYADFNVLGQSDDSNYLNLHFQEATSVPEPYTPLLAALGLFMIIRSRKMAK